MKFITNYNNGRIYFILLFLLICGRVELFSGNPLSIELKDNTNSGQMVSHVLKLSNLSDEQFKGVVTIDIPDGIRSLSRNERTVNLMPGDSIFVSYKLILTKDLDSGEKIIQYNLIDDSGENIDSCVTFLQIEKREQLIMLVDNNPKLLTNPDDSLRINVAMLRLKKIVFMASKRNNAG